jgi:hypothetical protein
VVRVAPADVDRRNERLFGTLGPDFLDGGESGGEERGIFAEGVGLFFTDEDDLSELLGEDVGDDGLGGEVSDGDGALVVLGDGLDLLEIFLHDAADEGGLGDGVAGGGEVLGEGHVGCGGR